MLIHSLELNNFKKYAALSIDDLPEQGVIKVGGKNESGKTSIGEAVCYALFARTFFNNEPHAKRLIRWGEKEMSVSLVLTDEDNISFEIRRSINDKDVNTVRVVRLSDDKVLADTRANSQTVIRNLLGYDYEAFVETFCMVQRELKSPDANSNSIKQMAGISDFSDISDELVQERHEEKEALDALIPRYAEKEERLESVDLDETWLPELIDAKESLYAHQSEKRQLVEQLGAVQKRYPDNRKRYQKLMRRDRLLEWLGVFLVPLMIGVWLVWGAFQFFPETIQMWLPNTNASSHDVFIGWIQISMFTIAMGAVLLYSMSLFFKWHLESKINDLNYQADDFAAVLSFTHEQVTTRIQHVIPKRVGQQLLPQIEENRSRLAITPDKKYREIPYVVQSTIKYATSPTKLKHSIESLQKTLGSQRVDISEHLGVIGQGIVVEKERSDKAGTLRAGLQKISHSIHEHEKNIQVRDCSLQMLQRAASQSIDNFNQSITDFAKKALPHFTNNRYSQLKINEDLSVEVFSDEKQNYMSYDEISSGTQRQIMLALRMGMSEELAKNTGNQHQFVFLDEPFAFFDHQRTVSTLDALPNVSKIVSQVWVTSQEFPEELGLNE